jgi:DNA invertase Pin-like site-specific DNA recombinase
MKVFGFIRTNQQRPSLEQKLALYKYANKQRFFIHECFELESLYLQNLSTLGINSGDCLLVSDIAEIVTNPGEVFVILASLSRQQIQLISLAQPNIFTYHESIALDSMYEEIRLLQTSSVISTVKIPTQVVIDDLDTKISINVRINIPVIESKPIMPIKRMGRPVGTGGKSKLDRFKDEIFELLKNGSTQRYIAKRFNVSYQNLNVWLKKQSEQSNGVL